MNTSLTLHPIAPFRLDYTVWALRRRNKNLVDQWDGQHYTRLFVIESKPVKVTVEQRNTMNAPEIFISTNKPVNTTTQEKISQLLEKMLGLTLNLHDFYRIAKQYLLLDPLIMQFIGLKPPCFPTIFEALVNAISCQQISLDAGLGIQNRLIQYAGVCIQDQNGPCYAFPTPKNIANCSILELKKVGYSTHKSEALIQLATAITEDTPLFDSLKSKSNDDIINFLRQFKGVGRWTAEYVLLRGLGKVDIFPGDDIGAQNNLKQLLDLKDKLDYVKISKITAKWHPYAGLIYFHLLLHKLHEKGSL